jgi:hypothetical protein
LASPQTANRLIACEGTNPHPATPCGGRIPEPRLTMNSISLLLDSPPLAAIGYSILYMIFGGGLFGATIIFVVAKIFRK